MANVKLPDSIGGWFTILASVGALLTVLYSGAVAEDLSVHNNDANSHPDFRITMMKMRSRLEHNGEIAQIVQTQNEEDHATMVGLLVDIKQELKESKTRELARMVIAP